MRFSSFVEVQKVTQCVLLSLRQEAYKICQPFFKEGRVTQCAILSLMQNRLHSVSSFRQEELHSLSSFLYGREVYTACHPFFDVWKVHRGCLPFFNVGKVQTVPSFLYGIEGYREYKVHSESSQLHNTQTCSFSCSSFLFCWFIIP